jgi:hypothetical protein
MRRICEMPRKVRLFGATFRARSVATKVGFPDVHPMM